MVIDFWDNKGRTEVILKAIEKTNGNINNSTNTVLVDAKKNRVAINSNITKKGNVIVRTIQSEIKGTNAEIGAAQQGIKAANKEISAVKSDVKKTNSEISAVKSDVKRTNSEISSVKSEIQKVLNSQRATNESLQILNLIVDLLGDKVDTVLKDTSALKKLTNRNLQEVKQLQAAVNKIRCCNHKPEPKPAPMPQPKPQQPEVMDRYFINRGFYTKDKKTNKLVPFVPHKRCPCGC